MSAVDARLDRILGSGPVLPVYSPRWGDDAVAVARALLQGGISAIEITLRAPCAIDAVAAVAAAVPEMQVGVGTVIDPRQLGQARDAGASFAVSPGATERLLEAANEAAIPLLPGVASASEVMRALEHGFTRMKLFPAEVVGGPRLLRALAGPFPQVVFCPTGGIGADNAADYLALANVRCVGGSWLTPRESVLSRDWSAIATMALATAALRPAVAAAHSQPAGTPG